MDDNIFDSLRSYATYMNWRWPDHLDDLVDDILDGWIDYSPFSRRYRDFEYVLAELLLENQAWELFRAFRIKPRFQPVWVGGYPRLFCHAIYRDEYGFLHVIGGE